MLIQQLGSYCPDNSGQNAAEFKATMAARTEAQTRQVQETKQRQEKGIETLRKLAPLALALWMGG